MVSASFLTLSGVVFFLSFISNVAGTIQTFIPLTQSGYAFHRGNTAALTTVEFFIDLTCPTCKDEWPVLNQVYQAYKTKVHFEYRVYPLPHHAQSFLTAQAAQVVSTFGKSHESVFTFIDTAFANQGKIVGTTTDSMTHDEVVVIVADWATFETGVTSEQYYEGMNTSTTVGNQASVTARNSWKYCAIQGKNIFSFLF